MLHTERPCPARSGRATRRRDYDPGDGSKVLLDQFRPYDAPGPLYDLAGGWTAFTRVGPDNRSQVWKRSPAGVVSQVSPDGIENVDILGMDGSGEIWFSSAFTHFYARLTGAPVDIGDSFWPATRSRGAGNFLFLEGGRWFAAYGDTIYELSAGYPRPRGATPTRYSLVTAYEPCTSPNRSTGRRWHSSRATRPPSPRSI